MFNPVSTYRIQFHKDFNLSDFERIIPYLNTLGVSTVYASPIFEAVPGSTHGYDGLNPHRINPEIGTEDQLRMISSRLKEYGMNWIQDIVPNHMAFHPGNKWLMDVLEKGNESDYALYFDINRNTDGTIQRLMVPFMGDSLETVVEKGELKLEYTNGGLFLNYFDKNYPVNIATYISLLKDIQLPSQAVHLFTINEWEDSLADAFKMQLSDLLKDETNRSAFHKGIEMVNADKTRLLQLAEGQHYRLCHWQETDKRINYRRFFTINGLICVNIHDEKVFTHYHKYIKQLLDDGIFQGLRIDHIDGLADPTGYLERLRQLTGDNVYITVEKILQPKESLPSVWPVEGNTGYDMLAQLNGLFTNRNAKEGFTKFYGKLVPLDTEIEDQVREKKALILFKFMAGELDNLNRYFKELKLVDGSVFSDLQQDELKYAIAELLIDCPVYRYYGNGLPLHKEEAKAVRKMLSHIKDRKPELVAAVEVLEDVLLVRPKEGDPEYNSRATLFYQRCMQFAGPLMAKGVEDTLMYTYNRFIGHNDVGDSPDAFGISADAFHEKMIARRKDWPLSGNATATHDTKRGEDTRARLNVMTDIADDWLEEVEEWRSLNADIKVNGMPDTNDEYFIYQSLVGVYPYSQQDVADVESRLKEYIKKALREAKVHSNWAEPSELYEIAAESFVSGLLDKSRPFWTRFEDFQRRIADDSMVNSLSQLVLKFTTPGVPDVYQGTELWDLSLVDPDNRRPVDYNQREAGLSELEHNGGVNAELPDQLWESRDDGKIKLWLTHLLLDERKSAPEVFTYGHYIPLQVKGKYKDFVLAFARRYMHTWYIVAVPLHTAALRGKSSIDDVNWKDTRIVLPEDVPDEWEHLLEKAKTKRDDEIPVKNIFKKLPFAILKLQQPATDRSAGILLSITSLPSPYGVGDIGKEARSFADMLSRSRQRYWQLLPLNPINASSAYSPYSSISSMAGNTLLISPDMMVTAGLLEEDEAKDARLPVKDKADYKAAEEVKCALLDKAYERFCNGGYASLHTQFRNFCEKESYWLEDFALYVVLRQHFDGTPWYQWPSDYRLHRDSAIENFKNQNADKIEKVKFFQLLFCLQWKELRTYCNNQGVQLFGDMPFYVSYDSADVWAHPEIFRLDENRNIEYVAGVPPDYFSEDGQLWGMPTFKWDVLKEANYGWWISRLRKNLELFDLLRLDHFRAFAEYWEVPAGEDTAKNGEWLQGPGKHFFDVIEKELGKLPFVAEDLGDNMEPVYKLRDEIGLPGMKVLQFAFGESMPYSVDIPHNYNANCIVYTGTHDNNTTLGWYQHEANKADHKRLELYIDARLREKDVHYVMARMAYSSVARIAILPMQDILGLDANYRMNTPGSTDNNWLWRLKPEQLNEGIEKLLRKWTKIYNRG